MEKYGKNNLKYTRIVIWLVKRKQTDLVYHSFFLYRYCACAIMHASKDILINFVQAESNDSRRASNS